VKNLLTEIRIPKVESFPELQTSCEQPGSKGASNWFSRFVVDKAALALTWLLLHTGVTANQITFLSFAVGFWAVWTLTSTSSLGFLGGALLFLLWYLLDHVDGQIARHRKSTSLTGTVFGSLTRQLIHCAAFFALGLYGYLMTDLLFLLLWGFVASFSTLAYHLVDEIKLKTFFEALAKEEGAKPSAFAAAIKETVSVSGRAAQRIFSVLQKTFEVQTLIIVLLVTSLFESLFRIRFDFRLFLLLVYGTLIPAVTLVKIGSLVLRKKVDEEYQRHFLSSKVQTK